MTEHDPPRPADDSASAEADPESDAEGADDADDADDGVGPADDPFAGPAWGQGTTRRRARTSAEQVRRRTTRSRRKRRRRLVLVGSGVLVLAVLSALAWLLYTGLRARSELNIVRAEVHTLRSEIAAGDLDRARATARTLAGHARTAHDLTTGPVWASAAAVPYLGNPADTVRASTASVAAIANDSLPPLIQASTNLDPSHLRRPDGSFDLAPIAKVAPVLDRASRAMQSALRTVQASPGSTWLGVVDTGRRQLLDQLGPLTRTVVNADVSARTVPALLGAGGPRSYLVSFQNEAELRGTGGLPGAFAIVKADHGTLSFTRFETDAYLFDTGSGLDFGSQYNQLYTVGRAMPYRLYLDSNVSPNFPYAAQIWTALWRAKTGQQLDGAMTIDPTGLSYLLDVTGAATLPDKTQVSGANVVALTQRDAYDRFAGRNDARKQFLLDVARAVSDRLISGGVDTTGLARAAGKAASEHRLLVWSRDASVEDQLATTPIGGAVPTTRAPFAGLAINNAGPNKLDYYLHAALDWRRTGCGSTRDVTVTITLTNNAPPRVPAYAQTPTTGVGQPKSPTTNRSSVLYFATTGSRFTSVTVNGVAAGATSGSELGHPVFGIRIDTPRNQPQRIVFHLTEPAGAGSPVTRMQPMINPVDLTVRDADCGS